jgi:hypothetical protein
LKSSYSASCWHSYGGGLLYICNPVLGFEETFTMNIFRAPLIWATFLAMTPSATFAQVRVISGDTEHIYGQGGQLLDDETLQLQNERAERAKIMRLREREIAMRQQELDAAAAAQAAPTAYDEQYGAQDGSYYIGTFPSRQGRNVNLRRIGTGPVSNSLQFRHANARARR